MIISGGANGIDMIAEQYADKHRISKLILRPQYNRYRRAAPLKRNDTMVDLCDRVLIFWDGVSKGSKHTIDYAKKQNKPIDIVNVSKSVFRLEAVSNNFLNRKIRTFINKITREFR